MVMNMKSRILGCVAGAALVCSFAGAQGRTVGSFTIARNVTYSQSGSDNFLVANPHDGVRDGSLVRTGKRAFGEIVFHDSSVLRINERTDLVVHDSPSLRNISLNSGVVWVKVKTGTHTAVQTPVGTATARGTAFLVGSSGYLHVFEGTVELADPLSKEVLLVHEGETALIGASGLPQMASSAAPQTNTDSSTTPNSIGTTGNLSDPKVNVDTVGLPGKEGFPHGWYQSEGELFGSYSDAGGTSDQFIALPIIAWNPFIGLAAIGSGLLFHIGGNGGPSSGGQSTPEPGTILILVAGVGVYARSRKKQRRDRI